MAVFHANDFMHPFDRVARDNLEQIPGLRIAADRYLKAVDERAMRQWLMSSGLRLGPRQLPDVYKMLPPICEAFGIEEPELYLVHGEVNAFTFGQTRTCVVLYSGLMEYLKPDEIRAVIAHECGHILCQHVLYRSMAAALERVADLTKLGAAMTAPIQSALGTWMRKSELSADRAAAGYLGGPDAMMHALLRFAGVLGFAMDDEYSLADFAAQAAEYESMMDNRWEKFVGWFKGVSSQTHPLLALRVRELQRWCESPAFATTIEPSREIRDAHRCEKCGHRWKPGGRHCTYCGAMRELAAT